MARQTGGGGGFSVLSPMCIAKLYFIRPLYDEVENHNAHIHIVQETCRGDIWALYCKCARYIKNGRGSTPPVGDNRTDTTDDHNARKKATERGETNEWGGVSNRKRECVAQENTKHYTSRSQLSSSFRPETLIELLLCRFIAVLLIAVMLFPTRVPGESLVPIVLEGAPVVVDDRGRVVGGTLEDTEPFRVVELCGVPLVRFLFNVG